MAQDRGVEQSLGKRVSRTGRGAVDGIISAVLFSPGREVLMPGQVKIERDKNREVRVAPVVVGRPPIGELVDAARHVVGSLGRLVRSL